MCYAAHRLALAPLGDYKTKLCTEYYIWDAVPGCIKWEVGFVVHNLEKGRCPQEDNHL